MVVALCEALDDAATEADIDTLQTEVDAARARALSAFDWLIDEKGDYAQARAIWQHLAENGDGQAMNNLGVLFDLGQGVDLDEGRALYWFARSASAGHPSGMSNYGRMLEQGRGIDANPQEAARWFDLAARQGQPEAQYNLGLMYESGHGVQQDHKAAAAWYSRTRSSGLCEKSQSISQM